MDKDQSIVYQVAVKAASWVMAGDTTDPETVTATDVLLLADEIYNGMATRMGIPGMGIPEVLAATPTTSAPAATYTPQPPLLPNAPVTTITDPGGYAAGQVCPKCGQGSLIIKTSRDGTKAWLQCSDKKSIKQGSSWVDDPNTCQVGPFADPAYFPDAKALWQTR